MSDLSHDFDARRVGWRQRRAAVRRLKRATWLVPADRELRIRQARSAQNRGELSMLLRGLDPVAPARPQVPTPPPAFPQQPPSTYAPPRAAPTVSVGGGLRTKLLIGGLVVLLVCGGGLVSCVSALVGSISDVSSSSSRSVDLHTAEGWDTMVGDLDDRGVRTVVDVVARRSAATISTPQDDDPSRVDRYYFDGDVTTTSPGPRIPSSGTFTLSDVDGSAVVRAIDVARQETGADDASEPWVQVRPGADGRPSFSITFPTEADSTMVTVDLDGEVVRPS